jgi:5,10-methylenetetrahydromethanopterin reductase
VRFSVRVNNDLSFEELLAVAVAAEQAGFDQIWVSNDMFLRSAAVLAGALAARTTRIGLGIAVMNPYSVHISELAMAAATIQEISGGRFLLGLGAGSEEFLGWAGIARAQPLTTTASALAGLRALLGHGDVDPALLPTWFAEQSVLRFPLFRPVPVYVGAMGPKMLELAGRHADGVLPLLYPPERYAIARQHVLAGLAYSDREFDFPACFWVSLSNDPATARTALAEKLAYYGPSISASVLATVGLQPQDFAPAARLAHGGQAAAELIDDRMLSLGVAGGAAAVVARCVALYGLGARHMSFGPPLGPDPLFSIRLLGDEVLPVLQQCTEDRA